MPKRTDIHSILVIGKPSLERRETWGKDLDWLL